MAGAYGRADVVIACAGAMTLAELAAVGLPALLVPLAHAALDHQVANAREFARATGAWWTREAEWTVDASAERLASLRDSPRAWAAAAEGMRRAAHPDAAAAVVAACEGALRHR